MTISLRVLHIAAAMLHSRVAAAMIIWGAIYYTASAALYAIDGPTASIVSSIVSLVAAVVVALMNGARERHRLERENRLLELELRDRDNEINRLKESGYDIDVADVDERPRPKRRRQRKEGP